MTQPSTTATVANFTATTRFADLPDRAVAMAVDAMVDAIGVGILGTTEASFERLASVLEQTGETGSAFVLGRGRRGTVAGSAMLNGTAIHALDFDDTAHPAYAHPSSHLLPVILALGENQSGPEIVLAYVLGFEVENALGRAMNMSHYAKGWHATATLGTIASAITAARLLNLDVTGIRQAIGLAASMASGVRANFGTMTKPLHAGLAARNGIHAAMLAREGFTATDDVLEHEVGYFNTFGGSEPVKREVFDHLGSPFEILRPHALALKPYPSCGATHPAIEAALRLHKQFPVSDIDHIVVGVNRWTPGILIHDRPTTPLTSKFSMQHCVAAALTLGTVGVDTFSQATVDHPEIGEMTTRIRVEIDPRVEDDPEFAAIVAVTTANGRTTEERVDLAVGKPERWFTRTVLRQKFIDSSQQVLGQGAAERAFNQLITLPEANNLTAILRNLTPADAAAGQGATP